MHAALHQLVLEILTAGFFRHTLRRQSELQLEIIRDHEAVYGAVIARDAAAAGERMREHVQGFKLLIGSG